MINNKLSIVIVNDVLFNFLRSLSKWIKFKTWLAVFDKRTCDRAPVLKGLCLFYNYKKVQEKCNLKAIKLTILALNITKILLRVN